MRYSIKTFLLVIVASVPLTGCLLTAQQERAAMVSGDQERCLSYGWSPGTDQFAACMMQADQRRQNLLGAILLNRMSR